MIDQSKKQKFAEQKEQVRRRINTKVDPDNYEFIPAKKQIDYYDNDAPQRVAVYARVSTGNVQQTTSYELQKKYYEDFVVHHPNWTLVRIYADEGISGTSLAHRVEFNKMIADCRTGQIDMIITKSVSRFARNLVDCVSLVRELKRRMPPVGVFFETDNLNTLLEESELMLSFLATFAQEESVKKSEAMNWSLKQRLTRAIAPLCIQAEPLSYENPVCNKVLKFLMITLTPPSALRSDLLSTTWDSF